MMTLDDIPEDVRRDPQGHIDRALSDPKNERPLTCELLRFLLRLRRGVCRPLVPTDLRGFPAREAINPPKIESPRFLPLGVYGGDTRPRSRTRTNTAEVRRIATRVAERVAEKKAEELLSEFAKSFARKGVR